MKRSQSSTPPSSSQIASESEDTPSKKPRVSYSSKKQQKETPTKSRAPPQVQPPHGGWPPGWDADKKEAIIERYLTLGIKSTNVNDMCREVSPHILIERLQDSSWKGI
jgi:hypothetical protein